MTYLNKLQSIAAAVGLTLGFAANADVRLNNDGFYELDVEPLDAFSLAEYYNYNARFSDFPVGVKKGGDFLDEPFDLQRFQDLCVVTKPIKLKPLLKNKERIIFTVGNPETAETLEGSFKINGFRVGNRSNDEKISSYALDLDPDTGGTFSVYKFYNEETATRAASLDNLAANYTKKEIKSEDFYFRMVLGSDITWFEIWPVSDHANSPRQRVNRTVLFTGFNANSISHLIKGDIPDEEFGTYKIMTARQAALFIGEDHHSKKDGRSVRTTTTLGNAESNIDKLVSCTTFKEKVTEHYVKPVNESYDPSSGENPILPE